MDFDIKELEEKRDSMLPLLTADQTLIYNKVMEWVQDVFNEKEAQRQESLPGRRGSCRPAQQSSFLQASRFKRCLNMTRLHNSVAF